MIKHSWEGGVGRGQLVLANAQLPQVNLVLGAILSPNPQLVRTNSRDGASKSRVALRDQDDHRIASLKDVQLVVVQDGVVGRGDVRVDEGVMEAAYDGGRAFRAGLRFCASSFWGLRLVVAVGITGCVWCVWVHCIGGVTTAASIGCTRARSWFFTHGTYVIGNVVVGEARVNAHSAEMVVWIVTGASASSLGVPSG